MLPGKKEPLGFIYQQETLPKGRVQNLWRD